MIKEDYVSFEVAKLLKEKGFNEKVSTHYLVHPSGFPEFFDKKDEFVNPEDIWLKCPTHQMAMKWLREVHDIFIGISLCERYENKTDNDTTTMFFFELLNLKEKQLINGFFQEYTHTYEEAVEAALKYCLEKLI